MRRHLTRMPAAALAVLALAGCAGGVPGAGLVLEDAETTWTLAVGQPEGSTCWDAA